ncbi:MAG: ABC transporter permease [Lachnospiraceae bacterium]|nr:ABC transporter permease [Lachnospiraceae bacterium]
MKIDFYPRLAWDGIRKNKRFYLPYILTCSGMIMMFYIIHHLAAMKALDGMIGGGTTKLTLGLGVWVIAAFALVFLTYTNSFLMRHRQKEFGLYNILGMGKKNLSLVFVWENLILYGISMVLGLVCGISLSKMAELGLVRMLYGEISYDFTISSEAIWDTVLMFGAIFVFLLIKGLFSIWRLSAIALMKSENTGEKPPRANYLLGIGGGMILALAYYIAVSIKSPLLALSWFMIAVILVILATYMIFVAGSVMLCRILQRNPKYYYQKDHFVAVSSMMYRMKRNGAGLASICILSTMVLVMMLGSGSLYFGAEDSLRTRYPRDISVSVDFLSYEGDHVYSKEKEERILANVNQILEKHETIPQNVECYLSSSIVGMLAHGQLVTNPKTVDSMSPEIMENLAQIYFVPLDEYNECMGTNETLEKGEVLIHCVRRSYEDPEIHLWDGTVLTVKKQLDEMMGNGDAAMDIIPSVFVVVNDMDTIMATINSEFSTEDHYCSPELHYGFDTDLDSEEEVNLAEEIRACVRELDYTGDGGFYSYSVECREAEREDFYCTFGGIFYLGIILSIVFLLATVLIIYYKQVTEGYEDESRFAIMQKVGMTKKDIRRSINAQMRMVFLLPIAAAVLHLSFAFPMVQKLLALFNLHNVSLMVWTMVITVLIFGIFYGIIYKVTSNAYYSIVSGKQ